MNFELIDNLFQVAVFGGSACAAVALALRHRSRQLFILALAYACFCMGTLYFVLYLAVFGTVPQIFYVSEISWIASYLFYLSLQIFRNDEKTLRFSWPAALAAAAVTVGAMVCRIFGPSYLVTGLFAITAGAITYLSVFRLKTALPYRRTDALLLACVVLQLILYSVSSLISDYTRFNLYFAIDITLTLSLAALLPLNVREVASR